MRILVRGNAVGPDLTGSGSHPADHAADLLTWNEVLVPDGRRRRGARHRSATLPARRHPTTRICCRCRRAWCGPGWSGGTSGEDHPPPPTDLAPAPAARAAPGPAPPPAPAADTGTRARAEPEPEVDPARGRAGATPRGRPRPADRRRGRDGDLHRSAAGPSVRIRLGSDLLGALRRRTSTGPSGRGRHPVGAGRGRRECRPGSGFRRCRPDVTAAARYRSAAAGSATVHPAAVRTRPRSGPGPGLGPSPTPAPVPGPTPPADRPAPSRPSPTRRPCPGSRCRES